jgi:hypothetical protein
MDLVAHEELDAEGLLDTFPQEDSVVEQELDMQELIDTFSDDDLYNIVYALYGVNEAPPLVFQERPMSPVDFGG